MLAKRSASRFGLGATVAGPVKGKNNFPALLPEVWVARAIQPNPGVEPGEM